MGNLLPRSLRLLALALVMLLGLPGVALAGGSWFEPAEERYEPGDEVTLKGVTHGGSYGWIEDGPFFGFLLETTADWGPSRTGLSLPLGELTLTDSSADDFGEAWASITFELLADLEPGVYFFDYCNSSCTQRLGDLIGAHLFVGVDPDTALLEERPLDDSEVVTVAEEINGDSTVDEVVTPDPTGEIAAAVVEDSDESSQETRWRYGVAIAVGAAAVIVAWAVVVASRDGDSGPPDGG